MLYSNKNRDCLRNLSELVSLQYHEKSLRQQDKLGKQRFHEDKKTIFQPFSDTL